MPFIYNFPFFSIMLCMFGAILSSVLKGRAARNVTYTVFGLDIIMSIILLCSLCVSGDSYVYLMGHFPAPWGNELRAGSLEAMLALFILVIALLSVLGGLDAILADIEEEKQNLYFILTDLMVASILALIYTNDLFTGYVFIEINTIAGCGLIMIRNTGKTIVTAVRYMVISLLGSGLFLIGVTLMYTVTGHLLMSNIHESITVLAASGDYDITLTVIVGLMTVGLAIKSGLFPFHLWIPDAYGYSNVTSSSLLSSVVSKGYIFLLIKIYYRVIGISYVRNSGILNIIFAFGVIAMIMGSVMAIREDSVRRIIAYSSVAQIGYIYMGLGIGNEIGVAAAIFHIFAHGATKSLLFLSSSVFTEGSHTKKLNDIYGMSKKYGLSAFTFSIGAFSMVGFPLLAGFISKIAFSEAAVVHGGRMFIALFALAISTILNSVYFLRMVICLYSSKKRADTSQMVNMGSFRLNVCITLLAAFNFFLGLMGNDILNMITEGLSHFG